MPLTLFSWKTRNFPLEWLSVRQRLASACLKREVLMKNLNLQVSSSDKKHQKGLITEHSHPTLGKTALTDEFNLFIWKQVLSLGWRKNFCCHRALTKGPTPKVLLSREWLLSQSIQTALFYNQTGKGDDFQSKLKVSKQLHLKNHLTERILQQQLLKFALRTPKILGIISLQKRKLILPQTWASKPPSFET